MGIEFAYQSTQGLLVLRVTDVPTADEVAASRAKGDNLRDFGNMTAMLLDLREQAGSILTAQTARAILVQCDRHCRQVAPEHKDFPIAILATPGSIGHGIGRMFMGHAYGLERLKLAQFDDLETASDWLNLPPDWQIGLAAS